MIADIARFPSPEFPDFPAVDLRIPAGWSPLTVSGSIAALILDRGPESYSPNLVVTATRSTDLTFDDVADAARRSASALPDAVPIERTRIVVAERPWDVLQYAYSDPRAGTLVQVVASTVLTGSFVVQAIGTVEASEAPTLIAVLRDIVRSITLTDRGSD
jgi:hypothetical protein